MKETKELPFFARFLETQGAHEAEDFPRVKTNIKAGMTLKYPSDRDEND
ncbi:MAG TPA: microviridin/marinostatin family tricyclic proteinase inhibitor [Blastocatellia bacterium]|nr:microviridin/marinostatin family tricyclic proteinase inhibitor [Blastocatellia bacterium]